VKQLELRLAAVARPAHPKVLEQRSKGSGAQKRRQARVRDPGFVACGGLVGGWSQEIPNIPE
jgi:hypothetical protein